MLEDWVSQQVPMIAQSHLGVGFLESHSVRGGSMSTDVTYKVSIRYMSEEETWINTYPSHPILRAVYDKEVDSLDPEQDGTLGIWLKGTDWL